MKEKNYYYLILLSILFIFCASIFTLQKKIITDAEPFFAIGSRMLCAGLLILIWVKWKKNIYILTILKKNYYNFFLLSFYNIYLTNIFEIYGLTKLDSSKVCLIYSLSPFLTLIITFFMLNEKITKKKLIGLCIGFIGVLIGIQNIKTIQLSIKKEEFSIFLAVIFSIIGWIQLKKLLKLNYSILLTNGLSMFIGGIFIIIHSILVGENWNYIPIINIKKYLYNTIITIIISNFLCYNLFGFLLKQFSITFINFFGLITPIFTGIFGYIFLKETINIFFIISIPIIFYGLTIFYKEESNK